MSLLLLLRGSSLTKYRAFSTDSVKRKQTTVLHSTDSSKRVQLSRAHSTSASKKVIGTRTHNTDSYKRLNQVRSHTTNSLLRPTLNYTRVQSTTLPTDAADLATAFNQVEYGLVASDNSTYVDQFGQPYLLFEFKYEAPNSTQAVTPIWNGKSTLAPTTRAVYLQIWNYTTSTWTTLASNNTAAANTDFTLTGTQNGNLPQYYSSNVVTVRVYQ